MKMKLMFKVYKVFKLFERKVRIFYQDVLAIINRVENLKKIIKIKYFMEHINKEDK